MSAKWPTSVATDADLYTAVNLLQTTLSGNINNSVTTITLASSTGFPTAGAVTIDNEVIFYTGVSGANLTGCVRGSDGTTAASHNSGVPVGATIVAFHHNGLMAEIEALETDLHTRFGFGSTLITMPTGSGTNPTLVWSGDTTSGFSRGSVGETIWSSQGVATWYFEFNDIQGPNGSAPVPTYSHVNDPNTGSYSVAADDWGVSTGGVLRFDISTALATLTLPLSITATSNHLKLSTSSNKAIISAAAQATSDRTFTLPDISGNGTFAFLEGSQTFTGSKTFSSTSGNPIHGNSASPTAVSAGNVGEVISATVNFTNFPTSGQYGDLTSISLTAGVWLVSCVMGQIQNGATVSTVNFGISSTSGNSNTGLTDGNNYFGLAAYNSASGSNSGAIPQFAVTISSTTTYYLKYISSYTVATPQAAGRITAIRIG